jgi:hypothetical protein
LAVAVRTTRVPAANLAAHVRGHEIPGGVLVTRPLPRMTTVNDGRTAAARGFVVPAADGPVRVLVSRLMKNPRPVRVLQHFIPIDCERHRKLETRQV